MRQYFLTVSDKNPIMFNDMLCEYCAVEIGPWFGWGVATGSGGGDGLSSDAPPPLSPRLQVCVCVRLCSSSGGSSADLKASPPQTC